ncbi:hypothetical protein DITRI_Ditri11bG0174400 [Diplodiscus trichospermus]
MVGSSFRGWCSYFQYNEGTDNKADARDALLVVATLIAAVTFQAGVNPPGGVWQETKDEHTAGTAVLASDSQAYYVFLTLNTVAFSSAALVIMSLTHKIPFRFEVWVAAVSMIITYGSAIFAVTPDVRKFRLALILAAAPILMRCLIQLYVKLTNQNKTTEPPCLIQACVQPRNKTTEPRETRSLQVQT